MVCLSPSNSQPPGSKFFRPLPYWHAWRDLPQRQQTLRAAIDWSYDLLSAAEQKLFRRLSAFVGGCTLEGAEAVCDTKGALNLDLLDAMASMVDKSLAQQVEPAP